MSSASIFDDWCCLAKDRGLAKSATVSPDRTAIEIVGKSQPDISPLVMLAANTNASIVIQTMAAFEYTAAVLLVLCALIFDMSTIAVLPCAETRLIAPDIPPARLCHVRARDQ
jgi:hypothetical protein